MGALQDAIRDRLASDSTLVFAPPGGLGFLVSDKWLTIDGPGSTPEAFTPTGKLKRSVVVLDPDEADHPSPRPGWRHQLVDTFPLLYLFAEASASGRAAIEAAHRRLFLLCHGWQPVLANGERPWVEVDGRTGARDDESFPGNVRAEVRLRATWSRKLTA